MNEDINNIIYNIIKNNKDFKLNIYTNNIYFIELFSKNLISFLSEKFKLNYFRNNLKIIKRNTITKDNINIIYNINRYAESESDTLIYKFLLLDNDVKNILYIKYNKNIIS